MKSTHILLIEDNEGDVMLMTEVLEETNSNLVLDIIKDGESAIKYLDKEQEYQQATTPDLILLDINLPKKSGHEVLHYIKNKEELKQIPVIMVTTSSSPTEIENAYKNHVNCYVTKPIDVNDFLDMITKINEFWFHFAQLPSKVHR